MPPRDHVLVLGGGLIGCAVACELAGRGHPVTVVERGEVGRQASWAAAGILWPIHADGAPAPLADLCARSAGMYEAWMGEIALRAGVDVEWRRTGLLRRIEEGAEEVNPAGLGERRLSPAQVREAEPALSDFERGGIELADVAQVRCSRLVAAVAAAAARRGAAVRPRCGEVKAFLRDGPRLTGVRTQAGTFLGDRLVLCAGAWSGEVARMLEFPLPVRPVRGQAVLLQGEPGFLRRIVVSRDAYLVPRADGHVYVGSTLEEAGFDARPTAEGVASLLARARTLAPGIAGFPFAAAWAGLRPATPDGLPFVGRLPTFENVHVAAGHHRNGILLAPITARLMGELLSGETPSVDPAPFRPERPAL